MAKKLVLGGNSAPTGLEDVGKKQKETPVEPAVEETPVEQTAAETPATQVQEQAEPIAAENPPEQTAKETPAAQTPPEPDKESASQRKPGAIEYPEPVAEKETPGQKRSGALEYPGEDPRPDKKKDQMGQIAHPEEYSDEPAPVRTGTAGNKGTYTYYTSDGRAIQRSK